MLPIIFYMNWAILSWGIQQWVLGKLRSNIGLLVWTYKVEIQFRPVRLRWPSPSHLCRSPHLSLSSTDSAVSVYSLRLFSWKCSQTKSSPRLLTKSSGVDSETQIVFLVSPFVHPPHNIFNVCWYSSQFSIGTQ